MMSRVTGTTTLRRAAQVARITEVDAIALAALDRGGHRIAAKRGGNYVLHIADHQTVARKGVAVWRDVEVVAANNALRVGARRAGDGLHHLFDFARNAFHLAKVGAEDLDADRRADARRQHVDPRFDRHG